MARYDFGKFSVTNAGTYDAETTYDALTQVQYNDATWISTGSTTGNTPSVDSAYWNLVVKKGDNGPVPTVAKYEVLLDSSLWSGSSAPYSFDLSSILSTILGSSYDANLYVDVYFNNSVATSAQISSYFAANIHGRDKQVLYAYGTKPSENLPFVLSIESGQTTSSSSSEPSVEENEP